MRSSFLVANYSEEYPDSTKGYALFNRVINIRFLCGKTDAMGVPIEGDPYSGAITLHSDYEAVRISDKDPYSIEYAQCAQKPSITIEGSAYKGGTIPTLTVTIANFTPVTSNASLASYSAQKFPFQELELHVGYIGQFYNWEKNASSLPYSSYQSLAGDDSTVTVIKASVIAVYQSSQNPDGDVVFECIPAEAKSSLPQVNKINPLYSLLMSSEAVDSMYKALMTYKDVYSKDTTTQKDFLGVSTSAPTFAEELFYFLISRRYFESWEYKVFAYQDGAFTAWKNLYANLAVSQGTISDEGWTSIKEKIDGGEVAFDTIAWIPESLTSRMQKVFTGIGALRYEIPSELFVRMKEYTAAGADTASIETSIKAVLAQYITLWAPTADAMLEEIASRIYPSLSWRIMYTTFQKAAPTVKLMSQSRGDAVHQALYVYDGDDTYDSASAAIINQALTVDVYSEITRTTLENCAVAIPCVNSVTYGAITKAVIPFQGMFPLLYPMKFPSSFAMSDFVSYYTADILTKQVFTCFMFSFTFATVEDKNECILSLTPAEEVYST